jgi:hypothetical protein
MRELRLAMIGARKAITVRVDDILLTRSRADLLGDSSNTAGNLYVQRVGGHWNVGAGGRFEIAFINGQVARWFNLASDPHRIRNLVEGTTLGPTPVTVNPTTGEYLPILSPGAQVRLDQRLIEMNAVRVVVGIDWFDVATANQANPAPLISFRYIIYATGQIYAHTTVAQALRNQSAPMGLLVSLAAPTESDVEVQTPSVSASDGRSTAFFAVRHKPGSAVLALVPSGTSGDRLLHTYDPSTRQVSLVVQEDAPSAGSRLWASHLFVANEAAGSAQALMERAADVTSPGGVAVSIGSAADSVGATQRDDGFDPSAGCYRLKPDGGRLRIALDGTQRPMFSPAFCVSGSAGRRGWVYVKHLIHQPVAADASGDLVFQLPGEIRERTLVEVVLEAPSNPSLP